MTVTDTFFTLNFTLVKCIIFFKCCYDLDQVRLLNSSVEGSSVVLFEVEKKRMKSGFILLRERPGLFIYNNAILVVSRPLMLKV